MEAPKFKEEPLVSFIVPIYQVPADVLKRCLMSLDDQDYQNIEIICVFDGIDAELVNVAVPFLKDKRFKVLEIEHGGACAARNAGFKVSTGEIVSFFNSDYIAKPGMVRMWVDALQENPDCGFAYGRYEYTSSVRSVYPSKPFDPWALNVANYIDCGFPLWRKHVVEWDVNCKSLQDWDFWLRVVANGVKGFYLGPTDSSFMAEPPRPKGLSMDSSSNWIERVHYVKEKNGIAEPEICVSSLGAPNHGVEIAKMIGADFRDDTIFKPHAYKALYMIGWYMKPTDQGNQHPSIMMHFDKPGVNRIVHFVGADIYWLRKFPYEAMKPLAGALQLKANHILCETELAQAELKEFGINAKVVPIPSYSKWEVKPLPEDFKVSVFLTEKSDFDKYCYEHTLSIIRAMPDVQFTAYGDGGWEVDYPNLKHYRNLPRNKWEDYVYENSSYIRLVRHDTLPLASAEFTMAGRDVITNIPLPFQQYVNTKGDSSLNDWDAFGSGLNPYHWPDTKKAIIQRIRAVKAKKDGNISHDEKLEAAEFWSSLLDKQKYIDTIRALALGKGESHGNIEQQANAERGDRLAVGSAGGK
jgi:Glycosyltransferases, probably involved in cell wall biogenesis